MLYSNLAKRWMRAFLRLSMIALGAIVANLPRPSRQRRQGTFIDDSDPNKGLRHLGNEPDPLIALVMHDGLVVAHRVRPLRSWHWRSTSLALIIPAKEHAMHVEAEIAVVVRQVRLHARVDDAVNVCPMKLNIWRMSSARTSVGTSVAGGAGAHGPRTT